MVRWEYNAPHRTLYVSRKLEFGLKAAKNPRDNTADSENLKRLRRILDVGNANGAWVCKTITC